MTTPTKLEIEHAERFEALGLFKDSKEWVVFSKGDNSNIVTENKDLFNPKYWIGPLLSCEDLWPVILEKCKDDKELPFMALRNYELWEFFRCIRLDDKRKQELKIDYKDITGAMREACLTLFEREG